MCCLNSIYEVVFSGKVIFYIGIFLLGLIIIIGYSVGYIHFAAKNKVIRRVSSNVLITKYITLMFLLVLILMLEIDVLYKIEINEDMVPLILSVELSLAAMAISVFAITSIFKDKHYGIELADFFDNVSVKYFTLFPPNEKIYVIILLLVLSILLFLIASFWGISLFYTMIYLFTVFIVFIFTIIKYLINYLFPRKSLINKIEEYIIEFYESFPISYNSDYWELTDKIFEYANSLKPYEHDKFLDFIRIMDKSYSIIMLNYQKHNSIVQNVVEKSDVRDYTPDYSLFILEYFIGNVCYTLHNLMIINNKRDFMFLCDYIANTHLFTTEENWFSNVDKMLSHSNIIWSEGQRVIYTKFAASIYTRKMEEWDKKSITHAWKTGLKEMFLDEEMKSQKSPYISRVEVMIKNFEVLNKQLKEAVKKDKKTKSNYFK